jgi:hypothetical protein
MIVHEGFSGRAADLNRRSQIAGDHARWHKPPAAVEFLYRKKF